MVETKIKRPFFIFNPKSFLYGEELLDLAKVADEQAALHPDISVMVTAPFADLAAISAATQHIIVTAQHMDGIVAGRGMGHVLPESLKAAGVGATFLNHAEQPMQLNDLVAAIQRAKEMGIQTIVCADSLEEAKAIASLGPDVILCEPTDLIGTGQTSDDTYIETTNAAIREVDESILIMQAAGISTAADVYRTIDLGADGTGCTSGITKAANPKEMLVDMIEAVVRASKSE